jgi:hypothetical protein
MPKDLRRDDLILPELSYNVVGACFDVYREIGSNHKELYLQKALAFAFKKRGIKFQKKEKDFNQIKQYLANSNCQLGLLVRFSEDGVIYKRVLKKPNPTPIS